MLHMYGLILFGLNLLQLIRCKSHIFPLLVFVSFDNVLIFDFLITGRAVFLISYPPLGILTSLVKGYTGIPGRLVHPDRNI